MIFSGNHVLAVIIGNPALWVGAGAVAIPLIIHLLTRKNPKRFVFPTIRFIKKAQANQSKVYKIRHLIMLALRTACMAFLVLAFLKPAVISESIAGAGEKGGKTAAVIILDGSLSMRLSVDGFTLFSRATLAAERCVDQLRSGDVANLIVASAAPTSSFAEPGANMYHLKRDIHQAKPTEERADIDAAIAEAVKQLSACGDFRKEIRFISDFQRTNWASVSFAAIPNEIATIFISVTEKEESNCAVSEVILNPPSPVASEEVDVVCKIANYGDAVRELPVQLKFGEEKTMKQNVLLQPRTTASVTFRLRPNIGKTFEGECSIPDDALIADNKRYFTLSVSEGFHILVIGDEDPADINAGCRYLQRAINPERDGSTTITVIPSNRCDKFAFSGKHLVIVSGIRDIAPAAAELLIDYLNEGGGVIYFLTSPADGPNLAALSKASHDALKLPFKPREFIDYTRDGKGASASWTEGNFDHPIMKKFKESSALSDIRFLRFFATEREKGEGIVLMRYDDKNIALAQKSVGSGSLLLCNFSVSLHGSDIAKHQLFVPMVQEMIKGMKLQGGGERTWKTGYSCSTTVKIPSPESAMRFAGPSGDNVNASIEMGKGEAAVILDRALESGFYRIYATENHVGSVAVNIDNRESNPEFLGSEQIRDLSDISKDRFFSAHGADPSELDALREGKPLWHYFLLAALCLLGLEQILCILWRT